MNVFVSKLSGSEDIPPFTIILFGRDPKRYSLREICALSPIGNYDLPALSRIWIEPGQDRNIILSHNTKDTVQIGQTIAIKRQRYSVEYGNRIYLALNHGDVEVQLDYRSSVSQEVPTPKPRKLVHSK